MSWMWIKGYEGKYMLTSDGVVKSTKRTINHGNFSYLRNERILSTRVDKDGYLVCNLYVDKKLKTFKVHRLVALAFIPNPENKPQVNHINGIKIDNRVNNLEWVTVSENIKHAFKIGLKDSSKMNNNSRKLSLKEIVEIRDLLNTKPQSYIANMFGVAQTTISAIKTNKIWN